MHRLKTARRLAYSLQAVRKNFPKHKKRPLVLLYVGELLTSAEAERRVDSLYLLEVDNYVIDTSRRGNVSRFLNHSCTPNLQVQQVIPTSSTSALELPCAYTHSLPAPASLRVLVFSCDALSWSRNDRLGTACLRSLACRILRHAQYSSWRGAVLCVCDLFFATCRTHSDRMRMRKYESDDYGIEYVSDIQTLKFGRKCRCSASRPNFMSSA